jgi:hypothetical protein
MGRTRQKVRMRTCENDETESQEENLLEGRDRN